MKRRKFIQFILATPAAIPFFPKKQKDITFTVESEDVAIFKLFEHQRKKLEKAIFNKGEYNPQKRHQKVKVTIYQEN